MATPTTEPLMIVIGGRDATQHIPVKSVSIQLENGARVSNASFTLENGSAFGVQRWQVVLIMSTDNTTQYFFGYIADYSMVKRGITRDYEITAQSVEVLLQKSAINTICTGTDTEILACMFSNSVPDLSGWFDLTGLEDLRLDSFDFPALDTNLLDAMNDLGAKVGANTSFSRADAGRVNYIVNPALATGILGYTGALDSNVAYGVYDDNWVAGNLVWDASAGETGGGLEITSVVAGGPSGVHCALSQVGRTTISADDDTLFLKKYGESESMWLTISWRAKFDAGHTGHVQALWVIYDSVGAYYSGIWDATSLDISEDWADFNYSLSLDHASLPSGDFRVMLVQAVASDDGAGVAFVLYEDSFMAEVKSAETAPTPGTYFDGETEGASWLGDANESASIMAGKTTLNWGPTPPDSSYDLDIGTTDFISDLELSDMALDGINTVIVTGAYTYVDVDWVYPSNNYQTHFDLEETVFPEEGDTYPKIYANSVAGAPVWVQQSVGNRIDNTLGVGGITCLYDAEQHWVEFETAPIDFYLGWRVVGRIKKRIRAVVEDEVQVAADGLQLVDTIYSDTAATEEDVFELGLAELARRAGTRSISFTTMEPGLVPGAQIDITDTAQGISETMIIERVSKRYLGGGFVESQVEAGDHNPDLVDIIYQTNTMASTRPPITADTVAKALTALYDSDNLAMWDSDNAPLYQST